MSVKKEKWKGKEKWIIALCGGLISFSLSVLQLYYYFFIFLFQRFLNLFTEKLKEGKKWWIRELWMDCLVADERERDGCGDTEKVGERERESLLEFKRLKSDPLVTMAPAILAFFLFFWLLRWIFFFLNTVLEFSFSFSFSFFTLSAKQSLLYGFIF